MNVNLHFHDQNAVSAYPVDDGATELDDAGAFLPSNILVDANLRWPSTLGQYAFVAGVTVTENVVSVVFQAASSPDSVDGFAPLGAVTIPQPVIEGRMYAINPQVPGVGGWVVFGEGVNQTYRGKFSAPSQTRLTPRAARAYRPPQVTGLRAESSRTVLTGVVTLRVSSPLEITKEERTIGGITRDVIAVRLVEDVPLGETQRPSVFQRFAGPCSGRPESNTCGSPVPIETINSVAPDCDGMLTLQFLGCATLTQAIDPCGIVVSCGLGLIDACQNAAIPDSDGRLPSQVPAADPPDYTGDSTSTSAGSDDAFVSMPEAYVNCFATQDGVGLSIETGVWEWSSTGSPTQLCGDAEGYSSSGSNPGSISDSVYLEGRPLGVYSIGSYVTASAAGRSVAIWESGSSATYRKVTTEIRMAGGPSGAKHNGGVVLNYNRVNSTYHIAEIDYDTKAIRISRFIGSTFIELATTPALGLRLDRWYSLIVTVTPSGAGYNTISARVVSTDDSSVDSTVTVNTPTYSPADGYIGLGTNRAITAFAYLKVEEVSP